MILKNIREQLVFHLAHGFIGRHGDHVLEIMPVLHGKLQIKGQG